MQQFNQQGQNYNRYGAGAGLRQPVVETPFGDRAAQFIVKVIGKGISVTGKTALLGWYFWTLPFRIGVKIGIYLLFALVAKPLDMIQREVFGQELFSIEVFCNRLLDMGKPLWFKIFPFSKNEMLMRPPPMPLDGASPPGAGGVPTPPMRRPIPPTRMESSFSPEYPEDDYYYSSSAAYNRQQQPPLRRNHPTIPANPDYFSDTGQLRRRNVQNIQAIGAGGGRPPFDDIAGELSQQEEDRRRGSIDDEDLAMEGPPGVPKQPPPAQQQQPAAPGGVGPKNPVGSRPPPQGRRSQFADDDYDFDDEMDDFEHDFGGRRDDDSQESYESEPSVRLPRAAMNASAAEVDKAVMLAIEAKQTHNVVEKLFWVAVMLMTIIGIVLVRIDFTRKWGGSKIGNVEPAMGFEGVYGVLVVLTIAFRSDFPFNLGVLMLVVFFSGVVFGVIIARSAFSVRASNQDSD